MEAQGPVCWRFRAWTRRIWLNMTEEVRSHRWGHEVRRKHKELYATLRQTAQTSERRGGRSLVMAQAYTSGKVPKILKKVPGKVPEVTHKARHLVSDRLVWDEFSLSSWKWGWKFFMILDGLKPKEKENPDLWKMSPHPLERCDILWGGKSLIAAWFESERSSIHSRKINLRGCLNEMMRFSFIGR